MFNGVMSESVTNTESTSAPVVVPWICAFLQHLTCEAGIKLQTRSKKVGFKGLKGLKGSDSPDRLWLSQLSDSRLICMRGVAHDPTGLSGSLSGEEK